MSRPIPTRDEIAENETLIEIESGAIPDSQGRVKFFAYWPDDQTPTGVRGQVFRCVPSEWIRGVERRGHSVRRWSPEEAIS